MKDNGEVNAFTAANGENGHFMLVASRDIKRGEEIVIVRNYPNPM